MNPKMLRAIGNLDESIIHEAEESQAEKYFATRKRYFYMRLIGAAAYCGAAAGEASSCALLTLNATDAPLSPPSSTTPEKSPSSAQEPRMRTERQTGTNAIRLLIFSNIKFLVFIIRISNCFFT